MKATNAAILAHHGATDTRVNEAIAALEKAMREAGKTFEKRLHEGAGHAFNNDTRPSYRELRAVTAWEETLAWFRRHLGA